VLEDNGKGENLNDGGLDMREHVLTIPELGLIAVTCVTLGIGIGLLLSNRLSYRQRKSAGKVLALIGGLSTVPLALGILRKK
jgi:hypothetical protein